jgi:ATP-dependent Clp protease ATP-binding subunit ClpX
LFIAGGAFVGLDAIVKKRIQGTSIGFNAQVIKNTHNSLDQVNPDDLVKFGLIPEFVGRFPSWVALNELTLDDLIAILTQVKHCYVDQYKWLFDQDQVKLEFDSDALNCIANNTITHKTGARGLHSELERVLLPHMFNLTKYKEQGISRVLINQDLVNNPNELPKVDNDKTQRKIGTGTG